MKMEENPPWEKPLRERERVNWRAEWESIERGVDSIWFCQQTGLHGPRALLTELDSGKKEIDGILKGLIMFLLVVRASFDFSLDVKLEIQ